MYTTHRFRAVSTLLSSLLVSLTLATSVHAETKSDAKSCSDIAVDSARLACYDLLFRQSTPLETASAELTEKSVAEHVSPISARLADEATLREGWFAITPHRPNYILPASFNGSADYEIYGPFEEAFSDTEVKMQLSLKSRLLSNLWRGSSVSVAYTQQSYWQLYADSEASAPFRETNHEPEIFWDVPLDFEFLGWRARQATLSFNHQSNGRSRPLSRSWNRITGELVVEKGRFVAFAKTWVRIDGDEDDDNPEIEDFMGRAQVGFAYKAGDHTFALGLKNNLDSENRSGVEANWLFPLTAQFKGFVQIYSGYGENMIDMEEYTNRVSIGVALTDWL